MLLIYPPVAKTCEPPAGIARLAGVLRGHGLSCTMLDANLEGMFFLLESKLDPEDTWSKRACRNIGNNLHALRSIDLYNSPDRYSRAVIDLNRVLTLAGGEEVNISLADYQDPALSPLKSSDLLFAAENFKENIFHNYFSKRLPELIAETNPARVGFSLNYLSQALCTFAMAGFIKHHFPKLEIILGGGLVTSWLQNSNWNNPFTKYIDHMISGPGEKPLLRLAGMNTYRYNPPDYIDLPLDKYFSPGLILPYAASSGCYWNKCLFCPEKAEGNPYHAISTKQVLADINSLVNQTQPRLIHFLDNAISPSLMQGLAEHAPGCDWYGFARVSKLLADEAFCKKLRQSGCVMLKLGIESGDQSVLDAMQKGIDLALVSKALITLKKAGIATYVYLLFGTPTESIAQARKTLNFTVQHSDAITFLNLAIFNMPICGPETKDLITNDFYEADLPLYTDFKHPLGWNRKSIRKFLDQEFKRHPAIATILRRDPPFFTSNHAAFFC